MVNQIDLDGGRSWVRPSRGQETITDQAAETKGQVTEEPTPGLEPGTCRLQVGCAASCATPAAAQILSGRPRPSGPIVRGPRRSAGGLRLPGLEVILHLASYPLPGVVHGLWHVAAGAWRSRSGLGPRPAAEALGPQGWRGLTRRAAAAPATTRGRSHSRPGRFGSAPACPSRQ